MNNLALRHNGLHVIFFICNVVSEYAEQSDTNGDQHDAADGIVLQRNHIGQKKYAAHKHQEADNHADYREHADYVPVLKLLVAVVNDFLL